MSLDIWNRRYTGSKYKLVDWIDTLIAENCVGSSFCDIFAGTGVVAAKELGRFDKIIINDFLHSNNVIYNAFFLNMPYNMNKLQDLIDTWSSVSVSDMESSFMFENYSDKYFSANDTKILGYIRKKIEEVKYILNYKEYCILLASLIYSADKIANTVGHYDAYIKGKPIEDKFKFMFVGPYDTSDKDIEIYKEDSNILAKKIECDIVYIDPPYNSRQYSRFYHILETLTKGNSPVLIGEALKPPAENMSEYCRSSARRVFADLIENLKCRYIVVSYNNTYNSKSNSSRNKMEFEDIIKPLEKKGNLMTFEKKHQAFNAGKTEFNDHKEFVFIVKVR